MTRKRTEPDFLAENLRKRFWPHGLFPVDPVTIAVNLGIRPVTAELPAEIASAIVKSPGADPIIIVEQSDTDVRKRYSVAHELGHYVLHEQGGVGQEAYTHIEPRNPDLAVPRREREEEAEEFAYALLTPDDEIKRLNKRGYDAVSMAAHFGVPVEVMNQRLEGIYESASS